MAKPFDTDTGTGVNTSNWLVNKTLKAEADNAGQPSKGFVNTNGVTDSVASVAQLHQALAQLTNGIASPQSVLNSSLMSDEGLKALADSILGYGQSIADAQLRATNSANALQREMWSLGEENTDRRLADQYAFNADQAQLNRDFQAAQSQAVMDWEAGMSNTAHQREVADLKAAGLNPVLSANAGASTPSVSTPSGSTASGSAIAGNHFQGHQANIVGAFSTAGQFISEYLGLLQNDAHFNREMDLQESNAKWSHALGIINAITGGLTSAVGLGISNKRANSYSDFVRSYDYRSSRGGYWY